MKNEPLSILERFPGKSPLLTLRMAEDPDFYVLCQDYEICVKALRYWTASKKPEAKVRIDEYRTLLRELGEEITDELKSSDQPISD